MGRAGGDGGQRDRHLVGAVPGGRGHAQGDGDAGGLLALGGGRVGPGRLGDQPEGHLGGGAGGQGREDLRAGLPVLVLHHLRHQIHHGIVGEVEGGHAQPALGGVALHQVRPGEVGRVEVDGVRRRPQQDPVGAPAPEAPQDRGALARAAGQRHRPRQPAVDVGRLGPVLQPHAPGAVGGGEEAALLGHVDAGGGVDHRRSVLPHHAAVVGHHGGPGDAVDLALRRHLEAAVLQVVAQGIAGQGRHQPLGRRVGLRHRGAVVDDRGGGVGLDHRLHRGAGGQQDEGGDPAHGDSRRRV